MVHVVSDSVAEWQLCAPHTCLTCHHLLGSIVTVTTYVTVADTTHYLETECMREAMETMLYSNGVDVVLNGHLHEYERTNPVYVSHLLPCLICTSSVAAKATCKDRTQNTITACWWCTLSGAGLLLQAGNSCAALILIPYMSRDMLPLLLVWWTLTGCIFGLSAHQRLRA